MTQREHEIVELAAEKWAREWEKYVSGQSAIVASRLMFNREFAKHEYRKELLEEIANKRSRK